MKTYQILQVQRETLLEAIRVLGRIQYGVLNVSDSRDINHIYEELKRLNNNIGICILTEKESKEGE